MRGFIVYKHIFPNGKVYVGLTCNTPAQRWKGGHGYKHQRRMWNAVRSYGWHNIRHCIVTVGLTREEACALEASLIETYQSNDPRYGYNATPGGESFEMTEYHKAQISAANKGRPSHMKGVPKSEDHRRKISIANRGKKRTTAHLARQSEYMKQYFAAGGVSPRARRVCCVETGDIFDSVRSAAEWLGVARTTLSDTLNGRSPCCKGLHWKYVTDGE